MGKRIGLCGEQGHGVYMLVRDEIPYGLALLASISESSILWHYRLGHPSHRKLQQALPWISMSPFDCESCHLGKYYHVIFRSLCLVSSQSLFELIHCDIWDLHTSRLFLILNTTLFLLMIILVS